MGDSLTDQIVADLKRDEGERLRLYLDGEGNWTIGVGYNVGALGISQAISDALLAESLAQAEWLLDSFYPWWRTLDGPRQRVVMNLAYNLGPRQDQPDRIAARKGLLEWTQTMGCIEAGNYLAAAESMLRNRKWVGQVRGRATRLAALLQQPKSNGVT